MNERIKELRMKVDMDMRLHNLEDIKAMEGCFGQEGGNKIVNDYIEKFAELIVRECFYCVEIMEKIAHASNADIPPDYDRQTYLKTLEAVTGLMKAHFGVEK